MSNLVVGIDAWGVGHGAHSGMASYASSLLRVLPATGALDVIAYGAPGEARPPWLAADVGWRTSARASGGRLAAISSRLRWLPGAVRADGIGVFHCPGVHVRPSFPPVPRVPCPLVVTIHDLIPWSFYGPALPRRNRAFYAWNVRRAVHAQAIATVSEAAADEIAELAGADRAAITVVTSAVDFEPRLDRAALARLGVTEPYVLYAGSYEPRKNLIGALRAFDRFATAGAPHGLVALTEPTSGHAPAALAVLAGLASRPRVRIVHSVAEDDLRALYASASAVLFPSLAEGLGLPAIQAAACGVPLVVSHLPVYAETVEPMAVLADGRDVASITAALEQAVEPEARRVAARLGPAIAARYTGERCSADHLDLYERTVERRRDHAA